MYFLFYKQMQILDIQYIRESSVLSEIKIKKVDKKTNRTWRTAGLVIKANNLRVSFSVILFASIYLTIKWNFPFVFLRQGEGGHVQTVYTFKPFHVRLQPTIHTKGRIREKQQHVKRVRVRIHPHVQNTLSHHYTFWKTTKKRRQSKPCMHLVTPRGTQCDTLCIIASIFLLIFATECRDFVLKWRFSHVHFINTSRGARPFLPLVWRNHCFRDNLTRGGGLT